MRICCCCLPSINILLVSVSFYKYFLHFPLFSDIKNNWYILCNITQTIVRDQFSDNSRIWLTILATATGHDTNVCLGFRAGIEFSDNFRQCLNILTISRIDWIARRFPALFEYSDNLILRGQGANACSGYGGEGEHTFGVGAEYPLYQIFP